MRKLLRVGVVLGAVLGVLGMNMTPASATTVATAVFVGQARFSPGLGYPVTGNQDPPYVIVRPPPGTTFNFNFSSIACVGAKVDVLKPKGGPLPVEAYDPLCTIAAFGTGTGYCGLSLASGTATIQYYGVAEKNINVNFTFADVGGALIITGTGITNIPMTIPRPPSEKTPGGPTGTLAGVADFVPNPLQSQCFAGTNKGFAIAGAVVYTEATPPFII